MPTLTSRRRALVLVVAVATSALSLVAPSASAAGTSYVERRPADARWVDGSVEISAPDDAVRAAVRNVRNWPQLFSDVSAVAIKSQTGTRQVAAVHSRILGAHAHDFTVVDQGSRFDVAIDVTGVDARGTITILPGGREGSSRALFSLYAVTSGVAGFFLSEAALRTKQEAIVRSYLTDLRRLEGR